MGLARPVRRQRGTGHRGGAVLVPAALHAEIDTHAPSARCAAAHCGVLITIADRAAGAQYPPYGPSVALPIAMPPVPLLSHLSAKLGPFLLDAGRAAAGLARPWCPRTLGRCRRPQPQDQVRPHLVRPRLPASSGRCRRLLPALLVSPVSPTWTYCAPLVPRVVAQDACAVASVGAHAAGSTMYATRSMRPVPRPS